MAVAASAAACLATQRVRYIAPSKAVIELCHLRPRWGPLPLSLCPFVPLSCSSCCFSTKWRFEKAAQTNKRSPSATGTRRSGGGWPRREGLLVGSSSRTIRYGRLYGALWGLAVSFSHGQNKIELGIRTERWHAPPVARQAHPSCLLTVSLPRLEAAKPSTVRHGYTFRHPAQGEPQVNAILGATSRTEQGTVFPRFPESRLARLML